MSSAEKTSITGVLLASFCVFVWGITFVCTKVLLIQFSALEILLVRFLLAYGFLWLLYPHRVQLARRRDEWLFVLAGLTGVVIYQYGENIAMLYTSASNVSIIVSICPLFTAVVLQLFLKEHHLTRWYLAGFVLCIAGVVMITFNGSRIEAGFNPKGDLMALAASIAWAFYSLCVTCINNKGYSGIGSTRRIFFWALVWLLPVALFGLFQQSAVARVSIDGALNAERFSSLKNWASLCFLGLGGSGLCFTAWNVACRNLGTARANLGVYLIPVVTIVFARIFLGEQLSLMGGIGTLLTIVGLVVSSR